MRRNCAKVYTRVPTQNKFRTVGRSDGGALGMNGTPLVSPWCSATKGTKTLEWDVCRCSVAYAYLGRQGGGDVGLTIIRRTDWPMVLSLLPSGAAKGGDQNRRAMPEWMHIHVSHPTWPGGSCRVIDAWQFSHRWLKFRTLPK